MITKALLARFESRAGSDSEITRFLLSAPSMVQKEAATTAWFAVRFGRGEFGIFDVFPDEAGMIAHLRGPVACALMSEADYMLAGMPRLGQLDVLAHRLPPDDLHDITKGLLLTFKAKQGNEAAVAAFLRNALRYVEAESGTRAWFAIQLDAQHFGIFDVFRDNEGRFAHLTGHVPRELARHALTLLGSVPEMHLLDVVAVSSRSPPVN
jgi:quinol monooxygenase YgiN